MVDKRKILIVDDHQITQAGLRLLFQSRDDFTIVGALDRGAGVGAFIRSQPVDLVVLDLNLPDVKGVDILAEIVGSVDVAVIILTGKTAYREVDYALKLGARAVVSKADPIEEIVRACEAALAGDVYISPVMQDALGAFRRPSVSLSLRQTAVLHYLAQGESNKEIAYRLSIGQSTVSFHIAELRRKLDAPNSRRIVERARQLDIL